MTWCHIFLNRKERNFKGGFFRLSITFLKEDLLKSKNHRLVVKINNIGLHYNYKPKQLQFKVRTVKIKEKLTWYTR